MSTARSRVTLLDYCAGCGDSRPFLLCVHHRDHNQGNNGTSNLEVVCGRCHFIRHLCYDWASNGWLYNTEFLTPRLVVDLLDKQTRSPGTGERERALDEMRLFYLSRYAEDPQDGSAWDLRVLGMIDTLEQTARADAAVEGFDLEEAFG